MRLVVFGWGNESRGDDGIGPALLRRVETLGRPDVETVEDYQLQIEHALDLEGAELALFIDASRVGGAPFSFREVLPKAEMTPSTHALSPSTLLDIYAKIKGDPPPAFVLGVKGESFALGDGLSEAAAARLEAAWSFLLGLIERADAESWRELTTAATLA